MKSNSIARKFTDTIELSDYEILSDSGWVEATHLHKTIEYKEWLLVLENGVSLICADDHIVFNTDLSEVFVKELHQGDFILTQDGPTKILSVAELETSSEMYDITVSHPDHRYYTNSILSHNTTTATAIILHYVLFNKTKTVGLLANKGDAAREILDRIKIAYEALPLWLQQGVIVWNKGSIQLENGSKVIAAATSSSAIRGKTCVSGDTRVCIEDDDNYYFVEINGLLNRPVQQNKNLELYTIYKTTNLYNGRGQIGIHKIENLEDIKSEKDQNGSIYKDGYLGHGGTIREDLEKYGPLAMTQELIHICETKEEADIFLGALTVGNSQKQSKDPVTTAKILSQGKFRGFDGFKSMGAKETISLVFETTEIRCTTDHEFLRDDGDWIEASDFKEGEIYNGHKYIKAETGRLEEVFDAVGVEETSSFYANGLTAHNCNFLYIDETAFVHNWDEFFSSVYPTISSGKTTKILLTSTPNGLNHFWKICKEAKEDINPETGEGKNGYKLIEVSWESIPGRDKEWMEKTLASMSFNIEKFNQEFCCSFIGSQNTLISGSALKNLSSVTPVAKTPFLNQYYRPEPGHMYALIADVSRGKGLDYSAFSIVDVTKMPYVQVLTYRNNEILPTDYAAVVYQAAKLYNDSQILVEINDIGGQIADILYMEYGYENLLFTENKGRSGKRISGGFGSNVDRGIRTTTSVKSIGCSLLKIMIEQQQLIVTDYETIEELKKFEKRGRSYEASSGSHDDLVMTLVLFSWLSDQGFFKDLTDINTMGNLRDRTEEEIESEMLPLGFTGDEQEIYF